jgi:hypothetical protein
LKSIKIKDQTKEFIKAAKSENNNNRNDVENLIQPQTMTNPETNFLNSNDELRNLYRIAYFGHRKGGIRGIDSDELLNLLSLDSNKNILSDLCNDLDSKLKDESELTILINYLIDNKDKRRNIFLNLLAASSDASS